MQRSATAIHEPPPGDLSPANPSEGSEDAALAMERCASRLREWIRSQPPRALIGYIWAHWTLGDQAGGTVDDAVRTLLLHYVHAVFAAEAPDPAARLDEGVCADILACAQELHAATRRHCGAQQVSADTVAKSSWVWP